MMTPANVPDGEVAIVLLDSIPPIQGPRGRPRFRPDIFQGDRAYGWDKNILATRVRGVRPELARPQDDTHGSGLGRTRWVVEGSLSWFNNHRRLRLCYERSEESLLALHQLAAVLICVQKLAHHEAA
jgi:transposase